MEDRLFIIYGAGNKGRAYLEFLRQYNMENRIRCFCDRNAALIGTIDSIPVVSYEEAVSMGLPFIIAVQNKKADDVVSRLKSERRNVYEGLDKWLVDELHLMPRLDYEREICAVSHINTMDHYFEIAETGDALDFFWADGSICRELFGRLDLQNTVELACGRGRHVPHYIDYAGHITLVDILEKNIDLCRMRFSDSDQISYVVNNGHDLSALPDDHYTSLFTYDSMVHFELLDIANYLKETYRILRPGGKALFHHSNNDSDYKASYDNAAQSRSFMSKNMFAYLAYRAGLKIEDQRIIDWVEPELDCLTLVVKE